MWWFTAVSRDSTSFNTGTTSPPSTPSHLDHILVRMQEVLDQRTHDGLEETAKSGGWQAPYRPEILAELFVISFWISTGWDGYRIKHPKGVSLLKIPRKPLEGDLIRLMIFDGLIALQGGGCRISATNCILGRLNQWIGSIQVWGSSCQWSRKDHSPLILRTDFWSLVKLHPFPETRSSASLSKIQDLNLAILPPHSNPPWLVR